MRRPILNNSKKGDAIYDPFLGSGTTRAPLIAAEMERRVCYGDLLRQSDARMAYIDRLIARYMGLNKSLCPVSPPHRLTIREGLKWPASQPGTSSLTLNPIFPCPCGPAV
jgi:hypothetical protein